MFINHVRCQDTILGITVHSATVTDAQASHVSNQLLRAGEDCAVAAVAYESCLLRCWISIHICSEKFLDICIQGTIALFRKGCRRTTVTALRIRRRTRSVAARLRR